MSRSSDKLNRDIRSVNTRLAVEEGKFNAFLLENSFATISTAIVAGARLSQIDLASPGLKSNMLRYSKFALTYPDGSNPTVIELKVANLPASATTINIWVNGSNTWEQDIFPAFGYPVGSLISGLDYQAYSVSAAASTDNSSTVSGGLHVQYNFGGRLSQTNMASGDGGNGGGKPFTYNNATGEVEATKFKGDGSALTNLPAPSPSGPNYSVQFNGGSGSFGGDAAFTFSPTNDTLSCTNITAAYSGSYGYIKGKFRGDNIGTGAIRATGSTKYWYLTPQDFMFGSSSTSPNYSSTSGLTIRTWQYYSSYGKYIATIQIPSGYKVVSVFIKGSANLSWSAGVTSWSSSSGGFAGSGVVNTEATGLNWTSVEGDFYAISIQGSGSTQSIYGARLTLEEV